MSIGSQTESQLDSSTTLPFRRPKKDKANSEISKTYKHASQLYLTRRLAECYEVLQPVIRPTRSETASSEVEDEARAPIALANTSQRIKTWSLYAALLNAIIDLGDEEGKQNFGNKQYREIVRSVQSGVVWEQVVRDGYLGREASVDAEVVYNLSNLLLQKAQDQTVNQARLETYLSTSMGLNGIGVDISAHFNQTNGSSFHSNGMDTPKDLNSRVKILELFTLHVLPQNNEWEYARSFVSNSDILDEERREALLQTLAELQEAKEQEEREAEAQADLVGFNEETEEETDERIRMDSNDESDTTEQRKHVRTSSEVDYGIEDFPAPEMQPRQDSPTISAPPPSTTSVRTAISPPRPKSPPRMRKASATPAPKPKTSKGVAQKSGIAKLILVLGNLTRSIATSLTKNPTQVFRTIMFVFAFLAVLARKDVRDRLRRIIGNGWVKVRQTAGMGVKVSYV